MIRIIVDSSADYLKEDIDKKQMILASLNINLDGKMYQKQKNKNKKIFRNSLWVLY